MRKPCFPKIIPETSGPNDGTDVSVVIQLALTQPLPRIHIWARNVTISSSAPQVNDVPTREVELSCSSLANESFALEGGGEH